MIHRLGTGATATFIHDEALFASYRPASYATTSINRAREPIRATVSLREGPAI